MKHEINTIVDALNYRNGEMERIFTPLDVACKTITQKILDLSKFDSKMPIEYLTKHITMLDPTGDVDAQEEAYDANKLLMLDWLDEHPEELIEIDFPLYRYHPDDSVDVSWTGVVDVTIDLRFNLHRFHPSASDNLLQLNTKGVKVYPIPLSAMPQGTEFEFIVPSLRNKDDT